MKKIKKCIAFLLSCCIAFQCVMFGIVKCEAVQTDVAVIKEFKQDNCFIQVNKQAEWDNGYIANINITNTGKAAINNWKLVFAVQQGKVTNIWNGTLESKEQSITFHALEYNRRISSGETITLGYEMDGESYEELTSMTLFENDKESLTKEEYSITYCIASQWEKGAVIEASIQNCSDKAISDWELTFDFAGKIKDIWNADIYSKENNMYKLINKDYNATIQPGNTVTLGFQAEYEDDSISCPRNERIRSCSKEDNEKQEELTTEQITTEKITTQTENTTTQTSNTTEEIPMIDWDDKTDSDKDGLTDVIEDYKYFTDKNKPDTDGDGLPDGYEILHTQTDPCLADSDGDGVLDGEEDLDADGLTNLQEYEAETPPLIADSDNDGVSDSEELKYKTRWDREDTDEDGVSDYDEIHLGLNPNVSMTYDGIEDKEYVTEQTVTVRDLEEINEAIEEFDISFDVKATNYFKHHLYTEIIDNNEILNLNMAIVGSPVYYQYSEGEIKEGNIIFSFKEQYLSENNRYSSGEEWGMKRYGVFTYNEEQQLFVPVSCEYQEEKNSILVDASKKYDNLCILDLEKLIHIMGKGNQYTNGMPYQAKNSNNVKITRSKSRSLITEDYSGMKVEAGECAKQVDLVLNIEASYRMSSYLPTLKSGLQRFIRKLKEQNIDLRVSLISYKDVQRDGRYSTVVNNHMEEDFLTNIAEIQSVIDTIGPDSYARTTSIVETLAHTNELEYRPEALKVAVVFANSETNIENTYKYLNDLEDLFPLLRENHISVCTCSPSNLSSSYEYIAHDGGGEHYTSNYYDNLYRYLLKKVNESYKYNVIAGTNFAPVFLNEVLTKDGSCDTDGDELTDSEEVDWSRIYCYQDGQGNKKAQLPTLQSLWDALGYGREIYGENPLLQFISTQKVLPVKSFPDMEDSDGDDIIDSEDEDVLNYDADLIDDAALDDSNLDSANSIPGRVKAKSRAAITESTTKRGKIEGNSYVCKLKTYSGKKRKFCGELTPKKNSDYVISVRSTYGFKKNTTFKVYKKKRLGKKEEVKCYKSDAKSIYKKQYYYALKKGEKYTIEFSCRTKKKETITISCSQDNWVYAKNGAIWAVDFDRLTTMQKLGQTYPSKKCFVTRKMLYAAACENEEMYMTDKELIANVMLKLGYNKDEYKITKKETGEYVVRLVFEAGAIIDVFASPSSALVNGVAGIIKIITKKELSNKTIAKVTVLQAVGNSSISVVESTVDIFDRLVKKLEYNAITTALDSDANSLVCTSVNLPNVMRSWESWKESHLINKYQSGCRGTVDVDINTNDVIKFCGWKNPKERK